MVFVCTRKKYWIIQLPCLPFSTTRGLLFNVLGAASNLMPMDTIFYCYDRTQFSMLCFKWIEGDDGGGSGDEENEAAGWHVKRAVCLP